MGVMECWSNSIADLGLRIVDFKMNLILLLFL
jgi:hypothetical protein